MTARKRLNKELIDMYNNPPPGVSAGPTDDNLYEWTAAIAGPADSPYEGGFFFLKIQIPPDYPYRPPKPTFITPVYHPNINRQGAICVSFLKEEWSPALTISRLLISLQSFLVDPNPRDPLVPEIAAVYERNIEEYEKNAKSWTLKYAT